MKVAINPGNNEFAFYIRHYQLFPFVPQVTHSFFLKQINQVETLTREPSPVIHAVTSSWTEEMESRC